jgi:hypothetical protein
MDNPWVYGTIIGLLVVLFLLVLVAIASSPLGYRKLLGFAHKHGRLTDHHVSPVVHVSGDPLSDIVNTLSGDTDFLGDRLPSEYPRRAAQAALLHKASKIKNNMLTINERLHSSRWFRKGISGDMRYHLNKEFYEMKSQLNQLAMDLQEYDDLTTPSEYTDVLVPPSIDDNK